jgi:hypothetical protein
MTSTGGSGLLFQYHVIYTFKGKNNKDSTSSDTLSTAVTDGHNIRTDLGVLGGKMQVLGHASMPRYSVLVYPDSKTFVFNIIDTAAINSGGSMVYQAVKVGNERVLGYNCIHSRLTIYPAGVKSGGTTEDIWTSVDVPGYADLKKTSPQSERNAKDDADAGTGRLRRLFCKGGNAVKNRFNGHATHHRGT